MFQGTRIRLSSGISGDFGAATNRSSSQQTFWNLKSHYDVRDYGQWVVHPFKFPSINVYKSPISIRFQVQCTQDTDLPERHIKLSRQEELLIHARPGTVCDGLVQYGSQGCIVDILPSVFCLTMVSLEVVIHGYGLVREENERRGNDGQP